MMVPEGSPYRLSLLSVLVAALAFAMLQMVAWRLAGGFEYPLDDPYIHLAIAEQIAGGTYGVNAGEAAAAASSPLFPLLLTPFAGSDLQRYLPLFWNMAGLFAAAALWGRILWQAGYGGNAMGVAFAIVGPITLNFAGLAMVGMEHMLHAAASLAIVLGLLVFAETRRIGAALVLGVLLAPLLRFEGLALSGLAGLAVALSGRWRAGLGLVALAVVPAVVFAGFLLSQGLSPVPSSVRVKLTPAPDDNVTGALDYVVLKLTNMVTERREQILAVLVALAVVFALLPGFRRSNRWMLLPVAALAGAAHLAVGRFGWMDRYEIYILATVAAAILAVANVSRWAPATVLVPMGMAAFLYMPLAVYIYPTAPRVIAVQQKQSARFAKDYLKEPVAVNDLGYVAWRNPDYVLDIWGLANAEAYRLRMIEGGPDGWVDDLIKARDVPFAIIYSDWLLPQEKGDDWRLLGAMQTEVLTFYIGGETIHFYLTDPAADPAPYLEKLAAWAKGLPEGASFAFEPAYAPEAGG